MHAFNSSAIFIIFSVFAEIEFLRKSDNLTRYSSAFSGEAEISVFNVLIQRSRIVLRKHKHPVNVRIDTV